MMDDVPSENALMKSVMLRHHPLRSLNEHPNIRRITRGAQEEQYEPFWDVSIKIGRNDRRDS